MGFYFALSYNRHNIFYVECRVNITGYTGVIESLNFPNDYPNLLNCTWMIIVPQGNRINITFSHFRLEEKIDVDFFNEMHIDENFTILRKKNFDNDTCTSDFLEVCI